MAIAEFLTCPMCGASEAFVIDPHDESRGYCTAEDKTWVVGKGPTVVGEQITQTKFTPGPWQVTEFDGELRIETVGDNPWLICRVEPDCDENHLPDGVEDKANANLIAESPDLHKLALRLIKTFGDTPPNELALQIAEDPSTLTDILKDARMVIQKVKVQS